MLNKESTRAAWLALFHVAVASTTGSAGNTECLAALRASSVGGFNSTVACTAIPGNAFPDYAPDTASTQSADLVVAARTARPFNTTAPACTPPLAFTTHQPRLQLQYYEGLVDGDMTYTGWISSSPLANWPCSAAPTNLAYKYSCDCSIA